MKLLPATLLLSLASTSLAQYINPALGHLYRFTPTASSWSEAEAAAEAMGGTLSALTGPHELSWILNNVPLGTDGFVWIGARDHAAFDWLWVDGEAFDYANWAPGEPNGDPNIGESFAAMYTDGQFLGQWADFYNTDGPFRGLVETCYANCDNSTAQPTLNVNDFLCFQTRFAAGDTYANCDASTSPPTLNVNDFICFITYFAGGC